MKLVATLCLIVGLFGMVFSAASQLADDSPVIALVISMDVPESPTNEELTDANNAFINMRNELATEPRFFNYTTVLVNDAAINDRTFLSQFGAESEYIISGSRLSDESYVGQKDILEKTKLAVERTSICDVTEVIVRGFMPQSFDQNDDTYKILDEMGIEYNLGYQAGLLYASGHEDDVWPYKVENHEFYAVPVSTVILSDETIPLDDKIADGKGISASQWYDMLTSKFDDISGKDEPMVVSLSTSISGNGDYLDTFTRFIAYAEENGAKFVRAHELLVMRGFAALPSSNPESECKTCGQNSDINFDSIISEDTTIYA